MKLVRWALATLERSVSIPHSPLCLRAAQIAACIAAALNGQQGAAALLLPSSATDPMPRAVTTCEDDPANPDPGSLRAQVAAAAEGETVDLSALAMVCSKITLGAEITIAQNNLTVQGPGASVLTIDGNSKSRIFKHVGSGHLSIADLTLTNGRYENAAAARGGCIYSRSGVRLDRTNVLSCRVESTGTGIARGGGIDAEGYLTLVASTVADNHAYSADGGGEGGGAYVIGDLTAKYTTISNNAADDKNAGHTSHAGGAFVLTGNTLIVSSTIAHNYGEYVGGLFSTASLSRTVRIIDSTISNNTSTYDAGGLRTNAPLTLTDSTVAFNRSTMMATGAGIYSEATVTLQSSILSGNDGQNQQSDLAGPPGTMVSGSGNIVISSTLPLPPNTHYECPQLQPLADNGGPTKTLALMHTSPAIDQGLAPAGLTSDQRGLPRSAGAAVDIGAVERQPGELDERIFVGGFDWLCDQ